MTTLIVGAGPAGCAAALWLEDLERPYRWIEANDRIGGTLNRVGNRIDNYLGLPAASGPVLVGRIAEALAAAQVAPSTGLALQRVEPGDGVVRCDYGGAWHEHSAVLLATGTRPRMLEVPGERTLAGIEISVTRNLPRYQGVEVCVVGGGDAALEGALLLAPHVPVVHLVHRRAEFRAQTRFVDAVRAADNVRIHTDQVVAFRGLESLESVELASGTVLSVRGAFIRIGVEVVLPASVRTDESGYVVVDDEFRTSVEGIWACGDLVSPAHQSVAWASGTAARAVRSIVDRGG